MDVPGSLVGTRPGPIPATLIAMQSMMRCVYLFFESGIKALIRGIVSCTFMIFITTITRGQQQREKQIGAHLFHHLDRTCLNLVRKTFK